MWSANSRPESAAPACINNVRVKVAYVPKSIRGDGITEKLNMVIAGKLAVVSAHLKKALTPILPSISGKLVVVSASHI